VVVNRESYAFVAVVCPKPLWIMNQVESMFEDEAYPSVKSRAIYNFRNTHDALDARLLSDDFPLLPDLFRLSFLAFPLIKVCHSDGDAPQREYWSNLC
jgi:hypothetical protein